MKLINVYEELFPLELPNPVTADGGRRRYVYLAQIVRRQDAPKITLQMLEDYLTKLKERMKKQHGEEVANLFYLGKRRVDGKLYYYLGRKRKRVGNLKTTDRLPIYFDLDTNEVYVPYSYTQSQRKRVNYILMTVLGALQQVKKRSTGKRLA